GNGQAIAGGGDFNGDGVQDLLIGHRTSDLNGTNSGQAYLVFGKRGATRQNLELQNLGANGFSLRTTGDAGAQLGQGIGFIGDFNGDGYSDLIVGAPHSSIQAPGAGQAYVVFGHQGPIFNNLNVSDLNGTNGFRLL